MDYRFKSNELYHYGKKGQRWGVRRYQNKDGTLTEEGKKRYARDVRENNAKKKDNRMIIEGPDPDRWVKEDISRTKNAVDKAGDMNKTFQKIERDIPTSKKTMDLSSMTDQQLRDRINRANLEKQYIDMFAPETVSKGRQYARTAMEVGGAVIATASSALGIALAIKELIPSKSVIPK